MTPEQRSLFLAIFSPDGAHLDPMEFITGTSSQWFYSLVNHLGDLLIWCPDIMNSSSLAPDHDGTWTHVHATNFAERFNEANLPVPHAAS